MNRYTYKAKRKDNGEWVYGDLLNLYDGRKYIVNNQFGACIDNKGNFINTEAPFTNEIIPETLCQCTGLQDIDGKDIFENDILPMGTSIIGGKEEIIYDTVKYVNGIYEPIAYWKKEVLKVVGNKFDKEED